MEGVEGVAGGFIYIIQGKLAGWKLKSVLNFMYLILLYALTLKVILLLKIYNSHAIQFTLLKHLIQCCLVYSEFFNHPCSFQTIAVTPKRNTIHQQSLFILRHPQAPTSTNQWTFWP